MRLSKLLALSLFAAAPLAAQAYNYPDLQTPRIVDREYNFAAASAGNAGTSLLFQWREGLNTDWQFSLDGGLAAPKSGNTRIILGGGLGYQWVRATADMPFDIAATFGAGFSSGSSLNVVRIPIGAAVGHTFKLDNGNELTPFVHPRLSLDFCSGPAGYNVGNPGGSGSTFIPGACPSNAKVDVDVDVGVNYEITPQVALRLAALLGGTSYLGATNGVGFSVAWTPKGLKKF
jgi:hypothetical protein